MLRTRLWMGTLLVGLTLGVLLVDNALAPWFPFLFVLMLVLTLLACHELLRLAATLAAPKRWLCYVGVALLAAVNWIPHVVSRLQGMAGAAENLVCWPWIAAAFALVLLAVFLAEMATFEVAGESVKRIAVTVWLVAYLGLLPSFLAQLRWLPDAAERGSGRRATLALAMAIFVPKCCDIGAYFTGRYLGKHPMAPVLSPKKTWEGAAAGLAASVAAALALEGLAPVQIVKGGLAGAAALGLALGIAGMLGDLAESLIKRDCRQKDASQAMPGFGGVLDVVDSVLFAAPVAYFGLSLP
jgi:phosphatidate cytidylyltransferase